MLDEVFRNAAAAKKDLGNFAFRIKEGVKSDRGGTEVPHGIQTAIITALRSRLLNDVIQHFACDRFVPLRTV